MNIESCRCAYIYLNFNFCVHYTGDRYHVLTVSSPHSTPRRQSLKRKLAQARTDACRLRKKLRSANKLLLKVKQPITLNDLINTMSDYLTGHSLEFCISQLKLSGQRKKQRRFSYSMKLFCLSLHYKSPTAYRFLRRSFCLPSVRTLQKLFTNLDISCGFSDQLFTFLKPIVSQMSEMDKCCSVCFDEMSLKAGLAYDNQTDKIIGFEDLGDIVGPGQQIGKQALVFMVQGILKKWKQPLGFFISSKQTSANVIDILLRDCLTRLQEIGLSVKCIICDQGSSNQSLFNNILKISVQMPYFMFNNEKMYVLYDPPHLLKCVRNNLLNHDLIVSGQKVSWKHISELFELDSKKVTGLRLAPKLSRKHIELTQFSKMKVKLAAQVLSHTVQSALLSAICSGSLHCDARNTAEFVGNMDRLFDCFNSESICSTKVFRRAIKPDSLHIDFLLEMFNLFQSIEVPSLKTLPPCILGWQMTIQSLLMLWNDLKLIQGVKFLLTRQLNQDCLENLFSVIRQKGGFRDNPSPKHFKQTFKQVVIKSCLTNSNASNCETDNNETLLSLVKSACHKPIISDSAGTQESDMSIFSAEGTVTEMSMEYDIPDSLMPTTGSIPEQNALYYVAGFVCKRYLSHHSCDVCSDLLLDKTAIYDNDVNKSYTYLKAYDHCRGDFGGLTTPSDSFVNYLRLCEDVFANNFPNVMYKEKVLHRMCSNISSMVDKVWFTENNSCGRNLDLIVRKYIRMRIYYSVKFFNDTLSKLPSKKRSRKALKVSHL